jgi:hypothetical protein
MSYKSRRAWALVVLLVGMPAYIIIALNIIVRLDRLPIWAEVPVYILLGTIWIVPFKRLFLGVGQPETQEGATGSDQKLP